MLTNPEDAYDLLRHLGAPGRLLQHLRLVGEAADGLIAAYRDLGVECDERLIRLGVAVHDAGKVLHPDELDGPGSLHEQAGQALMLANGVPPEVAKSCVSHAAWDRVDATFEERTVALADKLWKGKREPELELLVVDGAAARLSTERWDIFERLDTVFEEIAAGGDERLRRSRLI